MALQYQNNLFETCVPLFKNSFEFEFKFSLKSSVCVEFELDLNFTLKYNLRWT